MARRAVSLIIPNFNGRTLLQQNLPLVLAAARRYGSAEVLVVDDASTDGSQALIADRFEKDVRLVPKIGPKGFLHSINLGVEQARGEVVVLLNNDVAVDEAFIAPLAEAIDPRTFAATAQSLTEEGQNEALSRAFFEDGELIVIQPGVEAPDQRHNRRCTNFHASGGFSAFDRERFRLLGGFDPLFHPFYWEDVDLCFRAWKRGWRTLYVPESRVKHLSHRTISCYFSSDEVKRTYESNKHAFIMKNITEEPYFLPYLEKLSRRLFARPDSEAEERQVQAAFEALKHWRGLMSARAASTRNGLLKDSDVFRLSANIPC